MRALRIATTMGLLLFVGVTVGVLIAQEVSYLTRDGVTASQDPATQDAVSPLGTLPAETQASEGSDGGPSRSEGDEGADEMAALDNEGVVHAGESELDPPGDIAVDVVPCRVTAIYFHATLRCKTCRDIQDYAQAVVEVDLADRILDGSLAWRVINMQREREYIAQFTLDRPTLILTRTVGDALVEWTALHETWTLVRSPVRLAEYVREHVEAYLERCP